MSVLFMEGFETIANKQDLLARGWTPSSTTGFPQPRVPGRYPSGTALSPYIFTTNGWRTPEIGKIGNGISLSFMGRVSGRVWANGCTHLNKIDGRYYACTNAYNSGTDWQLLVSDDFINWEILAIPQPGAGTLTQLHYDQSRELWVGVTHTGSTTAFYPRILVASELTGPWTICTPTLSTAAVVAGNVRIHEGMIVMPLNRSGAICSLPAGADPTVSSNWVVDGTTSVNCASAVWIGDRWFAPTFGTNVYRTSVDAASWTLSDTVPNSAGASVAYGNGTIVVGYPSANSSQVAYSTDGGATFTSVTLPSLPGFTAPTMVLVEFLNGKFVAIAGGTSSVTSIQPIMCESEDGITWTPHITDEARCVNTGLFGVVDGELLANYQYVKTGTYLGDGPRKSTDGVVWDYTEISRAVSSSYSDTGFSYGGITIWPVAQILAGQDTSVVYTRTRVSNGAGGSTTTTQTAAAGLQSDTYYNFQISITPQSPTQYAVDWSIDGVQLQSSTITVPLFDSTYLWFRPNSGIPAASAIMYGSYAYDGNGTLTTTPNATTLQVTHDKGATFTSVAAPFTMNGFTRILWVVDRFVFLGQGIALSPNAESWTTVVDSSASITAGESNGDTVVATTGSTTLYHSIDRGDTWVTVEAPQAVEQVQCLDGVWVGVTTSANRGLVYSSDDGVTWDFVSVPSLVALANYSCVAFNGIYFGSSNRVILDDGVPILDPEYTSPSGSNNALAMSNGQYLLFYSVNGRYYSADGYNFTALSSLQSRWVVSATVDEAFVIASTASGASYVLSYWYPTFGDAPMRLQIGAGFSAIDDIVVTDFNQPNAGPQGECRIIKKPKNTQPQADWTPVPDTLTNVQAATSGTLTTTTSHVEASGTGQVDAYGSSGFVLPLGLRPLAVQVEAGFERLFTNTPTVRLGLSSNDSQEQTADVPITAAPGSKVYVQKIVERNPDGDVSWNAASVVDTLLTIEKTG